MTTTVDRQDASPQQYRVVGTRPIRHDGLDKVTGAAKYGADTQLVGMLHGKILRSPPRSCSYPIYRYQQSGGSAGGFRRGDL